MSSSEIQAVRNQIDAMLKQDIIRPSKSPSGAPAIRVRRKDLQGKPQPPRFVVDYRALNSGRFPFNKNSGFWNFRNFTWSMERYILVAQTRSKPPRVFYCGFAAHS